MVVVVIEQVAWWIWRSLRKYTYLLLYLYGDVALALLLGLESWLKARSCGRVKMIRYRHQKSHKQADVRPRDVLWTTLCRGTCDMTLSEHETSAYRLLTIHRGSLGASRTTMDNSRRLGSSKGCIVFIDDRQTSI